MKVFIFIFLFMIAASLSYQSYLYSSSPSEKWSYEQQAQIKQVYREYFVSLRGGKFLSTMPESHFNDLSAAIEQCALEKAMNEYSTYSSFVKENNKIGVKVFASQAYETISQCLEPSMKKLYGQNKE